MKLTIKTIRQLIKEELERLNEQNGKDPQFIIRKMLSKNVRKMMLNVVSRDPNVPEKLLHVLKHADTLETATQFYELAASLVQIPEVWDNKIQKLQDILHTNPIKNLDDVNLEGINFQQEAGSKGLRLDGYSFMGASLDDANFSGCVIIDCDFTEAALNHAVLQSATFKNCKFNGADMSGARLNDSIFINCDFTDADVEGVNMKANFIWSDESPVHLQNVKFHVSTMPMTMKDVVYDKNTTFSKEENFFKQLGAKKEQSPEEDTEFDVI